MFGSDGESLSGYCAARGASLQPNSVIHSAASVSVGPGRLREGSLHNVFPTVTSMSLARTGPAGSKGGSRFPHKFCVVSSSSVCTAQDQPAQTPGQLSMLMAGLVTVAVCGYLCRGSSAVSSQE